MIRFSLVLFVIFLFTSCCQQKTVLQNDCCKSFLKKDFENYSLKKLGKEYKRIKKNSDKCCEIFGSDFQKIIQALCEKLSKTGSDSAVIVHAMGIPDATEVPKQYGIFNTGNEKIMVYWWRHWRDFIYFITVDGKVKQGKWFNAYE